MLDIKSLRLTAEEVEALPFEPAEYWEGRVADAALAKAIWGVQEWLTKASADPKGYMLRAALTDLNTQLLAAGIIRPEGET